VSCNGFARPDPLEILFADSPILGAFGGVRVAEDRGIFDNTFQYDTSPVQWETVLTNNGTETHLPNESSVRLRTTNTNTDKVVKQTRRYMRYQPGKGQYIRCTAVMPDLSESGLRRRFGYFDADNGIFLEQTFTGLSIVRRSKATGSVVDEAVAQASWSVDKLDGTGVSGKTIQPAKIMHLVIDAEWLGAGRVRVGFDFGGKVAFAHEFINVNVLTTVYCTTFNLPMRYEIENTAAMGADHDLIAVCQSVSSQAGQEEERGYDFGVGNIAVVSGIGTGAWVPLVSIRPAATFNSLVNRGTIIPEFVSVVVGSGSAAWRLFYAPTALTAASFASVHASSITEFDVAATAITAGLPIVAGFASGGAAVGDRRVDARDFTARYPLTLDIAGANPIVLTLAARALSGLVDAAGAISFKELR